MAVIAKGRGYRKQSLESKVEKNIKGKRKKRAQVEEVQEDVFPNIRSNEAERGVPPGIGWYQNV